MTTNDLTNELVSGPQAAGRSATRRPVPGRPLVFSTLLSLLLAVPALPALADDAGTVASSTATAPLAVSDPLPMADRSMLFGANLEQLIASQPIAARPEVREPVSEKIQSVLRRAMAMLGTPYRWGGTTENGFDCSGLVNYVFKSALGIDLPRVSRDMARSGEQVDRNALTAGDLVFFSRRGRRVDHVGIYVGDGQFVHAPRTGKDVMVSRLDTGYWRGKFMQARRVAGI